MRCCLVVIVLAAGLLGCGEDAARDPVGGSADGASAASGASAGDRDTATDARDPRSDAARPPRSALARNAADANRFVGDGPTALERRLAELKGHPVVVNLWASWCAPCRFEFPFFAAATKRHAARVGFVGVDVMDSRDLAQSFVEEQPPGFPSIYDGDGKAARSFDGPRAMPTTYFLGREGRVVHAKLGGYARAAELERDIRRYALGER